MIKKTLGGDRLGSGKKMQVELNHYERSNHDLSYIWRSTASPGTLIPFMKKVLLPGDTFDIDLDVDVKTHPTIGPLFGSYKVQLDVFMVPIRLYHALLHNNELGIGLKMQSVKLPKLRLSASRLTQQISDVNNAQTNPSCILRYLGITGVGNNRGEGDFPIREFNAVPFLAYWDIYKNYYANKQEELGAVINTPTIDLNQTILAVTVDGNALPEDPSSAPFILNTGSIINVQYSGAAPSPATFLFYLGGLGWVQANTLGDWLAGAPTSIELQYDGRYGIISIESWRYITGNDTVTQAPKVTLFNLSNIDLMRRRILRHPDDATSFNVNLQALQPYSLVLAEDYEPFARMSTQEGLAVKTYQSDLFNNWLSTEWIDGAGGINEITAIDTSSGSFTLDELMINRKVYDMLNRIAVSGGSYNDWLESMYTEERLRLPESPVYMGSLIREVAFQEVVSNAASDGLPLGTLAGKGIMTDKRKGGKVIIKADEPAYAIGIVSITPRIDYSQGNDWDVNLDTMDDLHKPALDEIGFQELITDQMAYWDTDHNGTQWVFKSAGKQPAWINYMTAINKTYGNFAVESNEMFMTLNRKYEFEPNTGIRDLTTYIDPVKFNSIFANTSLDAQNFWVQIAVDINARRKISAKVMPNL